MGNKLGHIDRANALREMSRTAPGTQLEILQPSMRIGSPRPHWQDEIRNGGQGSKVGDFIGLTDECEYCGDPLPRGSTIRRIYCSAKCWKASIRALEALETRTGRICPQCGGEVPQRLDARAKYCSTKCEKRSAFARNRRKQPLKPCPVCDKKFHPFPSRQVCCSYACRDELAKRRKG